MTDESSQFDPTKLLDEADIGVWTMVGKNFHAIYDGFLLAGWDRNDAILLIASMLSQVIALNAQPHQDRQD